MIGLIIAMHVVACVLLIIIILIQSGRGAGLVESFSGIESMLGVKTNKFLTRTTSVLSVIFIFTCLTLAFFSAKQSRSLMKDIKIEETTQEPLPAATKTSGQAPPEEDMATQGMPAEHPLTTQEAPKTE